MIRPTTVRFACLLPAAFATGAAEESAAPPWADMVANFCIECHDADANKGGLDLDLMLDAGMDGLTADWERVVRQLRARQMPPAGKPRPDEAGYLSAEAALESALDREAEAHPDPGRTETLRRLNRTEYQNAIRDLLAVEIDASALLPPDESSHGFDNVTVSGLSPALLDRYITAAQKISLLAVGGARRDPGGSTIRIRPDLTQEEHVEGLPVGTRGGALIRHTFPRDGDYEIRVRLMRDRNEEIEGLRGRSHELEVLLDRGRAAAFKINPPPNPRDHTMVDAHLKARIPVTAGPHDLGVTFLKNPSSLEETLRLPYQAHFNMHRHPRLSPAVYQVSITGPFDSEEPGESPSRRRLFIATPSSTARADEDAAAEKILESMMRRAYRRPITKEDLVRPMRFFRDGRDQGGFDAGVESAVAAVLVSRKFLFRVERDPEGIEPRTPYVLGDFELATRLSFFLWSSIPDDELLELAVRGELGDPDMLAKQTRRMLADDRSQSLVTNFAGQWLHLRNLDSITPDGRLFPGFDDNLRQALRHETERFFGNVLHEDRSVLDLLKSDFTFLNERLAKHYGVPHVYGSRFRRVELEPESHRGGLLRHGSILMVTSYATRTSPVIRGNWILKNLLGTAMPPPPPDVPALEDNTVSARLPMRERLAAHRENAICARCHDVMDPVGFALENFDAVGRWRTTENNRPVNASGGMPDGSEFSGVTGLEAALLRRPELFVRTLTEKLLTFALGRGIDHNDAPAVRAVARATSRA